MVRALNDPSEHLQQLGLKCRGEIDFSRFLSELGSLRDDLLAELIEQDGRMRLARGKAVTLERYIEAVPDLLDRPDPLDAAIDVTLRSLSRSSHPDEKAIDQLIERYPALSDSIEEAAALNNALWSTTGLRRKISERSTRLLPQDFGPPISGSGSGESRYVLQKLLGSGAYGQVYLAVDRQLSDEGHPALVAVKILSNDDRDAPSRHALAEEATKARRIDHPNVVRVLDRGISGSDEDYIVYEYVDGGDLGRWLRNQRGPIPIRDAARLAARIARGVQAAHAAGLVHCDLKPGNIMLKQPATSRKPWAMSVENSSHSPQPIAHNLQPIPKVADFGIAIRSGESLTALQGDDEQRHPIGNLAYISPEQYRMEDGSLTVPSDVYALGGILFTLLTGSLPNGSTVEQIAETHHPELGRTTPPRLRPLRPEIDADLEAICCRAMAIKPEDRYSAAGALADDLEAWLRHEPIYWTGPNLGRLTHLWIKRRPTMAASLLVGTLLVGSGAMVAGHYAIAARTAAAEARESAALALQHQQQKEIEQLRADQEQLRADQQAKINAAHISFVRRTLDRLYHLSESSPTATQLLSLAWVYQRAFEESEAPLTDGSLSFEDVRMLTVERLIDRLSAEGREDSLEVRLWQTNLVFWMIGRNQIDRAHPLMRELQEAWPTILNPGDPWLDLISALDAALTVRTHHAARKEQEVAPVRPAEGDGGDAALIEAEGVLTAYERQLDATDPGSPVHQLILEVMLELYGPKLLDRPTKYDQVAAQLDEMSQADYIKRRTSSGQ